MLLRSKNRSQLRLLRNMMSSTGGNVHKPTTDLTKSASMTSSSVPDNTTSFAMSGCGWLCVFYYGVIDRLREGGYMTDRSVLAGTSGGALGALIGCVSSLNGRQGLQMAIDMSQDRVFRHNIDLGLKKLLPTILPDDTLDFVQNRLHVCVTKVWQPGPKIRAPTAWASPEIINKWQNKTELVDTIAASCYIPMYSSRQLFTNIHGQKGFYVDGGFFGGFMPPIGDVKISPFAIRAMFMRRAPQITIRTGQGASFSNVRLLSWVLNPAPPDVLEELYLEGYRAAGEWILQKEENENFTKRREN